MSFSASAFTVVGAVCDAIAQSVSAIAARVSTELGGQGDSCTEEEEHIEDIHGSWNELVEGEFFLESNRDEVEQSDHGEDGNEYRVVDDGWVAGKSCGNHVAS